LSENFKIICGGQSGVDRAALDFAIECGFESGGWCPKGRLAEDGIIPEKYPLIETATDDYTERTKLNVMDSDSTLILFNDEMDVGTLFTLDCAEELNKQYFLMDFASDFDARIVRDWLINHEIGILNIAGPRESNNPGIYKLTKTFLALLFPQNK